MTILWIDRLYGDELFLPLFEIFQIAKSILKIVFISVD